MRNLKDDFFKDKNINSSDLLEKTIAANLENDQMYDGEPMVATRVTAAESHDHRQPAAPYNALTDWRDKTISVKTPGRCQTGFAGN